MAKKTNKWVLETTGVDRSLFATVKQRKLTYFGHILRRSGDCLEKEVNQVHAHVADQRRLGSTSHHGLVYHHTSYWKEQGIKLTGK